MRLESIHHPTTSIQFYNRTSIILYRLQKNFVITGTLSIGRDAMKELIESKGGKVSGAISAKTSYLLAGEAGGSKRTAAEKLGIPVINETELSHLLAAKVFE